LQGIIHRINIQLPCQNIGGAKRKHRDGGGAGAYSIEDSVDGAVSAADNHEGVLVFNADPAGYLHYLCKIIQQENTGGETVFLKESFDLLNFFLRVGPR
jgi:hypothetical protein